MTPALVLLGTIGVALLSRQIWELLLWAARAILQAAVRLLAAAERERCEEEWFAEFNRLPAGLPMLAWALSYFGFALVERLSIALGGAWERRISNRGIDFLPARWPWSEVQATCSKTEAGDVRGAVAIGLGRNIRAIKTISRTLSIGSEGDGQCRVTWKRDSASECTVTLESKNRGQQHRFVRIEDGSLESEFSIFYIRDGHHVPGIAVNLLRNALVMYDRLGVRHVITYTGAPDSQVVWAKLGAAPIDDKSCRYHLLSALAHLVEAQEIKVPDGSELLKAIENTRASSLMYDIVRTVNTKGDHIGAALVKQTPWMAYFDLDDDEQRQRLVYALGSPPDMKSNML